MRQLRLCLLVLTGWLLLPGPAQADPVTIAIAVTTALPFVSAAVDTFIFFAVQAAVYAGYTWAASKLASAGQKAQTGQERQASVTQLQIGESDREAIIGECATGGQLIDAFNYGGKYGTDWEVLVIAVADHRCEALTGFYIGDAYYAFSGSGAQSGFGGQLVVNWHDGRLDQAADDLLTGQSGRWTSTDRVAGVAYIVVAYKADDPKAAEPIWSTGRPNFLWLVKGARLYDPRKDSTVTGGSGDHRWEEPETWEWSDNAALGRFAYVRGFYAGDHVGTPSDLMIGRGLSVAESPGDRIIAAANVCDELVTLKAGGTERRYRANGVLRAGEPFIVIEEMFAAAMAGVIVQRDGGVEIEPGVSKSAVVTLTDGDLIIGEPVHIDNFTSQNDRINTVTPRFTDPGQIWRDTAAPVRRSSADIIADGGLYSRSIPLTMVTSHTQAQRCGEIERRLARKERRGSIVLGPRFSYLEDGDWIAWQSDRYFEGATVVFRIEAINIGADYRTSLIMREIAASVFAWTASTDEGTPGQAPVDEAGSLDHLTLDDVEITALSLSGDDLTVIPAVQASWSTPVDVGVLAVRLELRQGSSGDLVTLTQTVPQEGQIIVSNGVPAATALQVRVVPVGSEGRQSVPSDWVNVLTTSLTATGVSTIGGKTPAQVLADLAYVVEQGRLLTQAGLETFGRLQEDRIALYQATLIDGQHVKTVVLDEITARQTADTAFVNQLNLIGAVSLDGASFVLSDSTVMATSSQTWGQYKTAVTAAFAANSAAISNEVTARTTAVSAIASDLTSLTTTVGSNTASITTLQTSANGFDAQYVLALDVNGKVSGLKLASSPTVSSIAFVADQIGFANSAGSTIYPLTISGGVVRATNFEADRVKANTITATEIISNSIVESHRYALGSTVGVTSGAETSIMSQSVTTSGGFIDLDIFINCNGNVAGGTSMGVIHRLYRDGSLIMPFGHYMLAGKQFNSTTFTYREQPSAGSHTYEVTSQRDNGSGFFDVDQLALTVRDNKTQA